MNYNPERRSELMLALSKCWPEFTRYNSAADRIEYVGAVDPSGYVSVIQGSYHRLDNDAVDAKLTEHMLYTLRSALTSDGAAPFGIRLEHDGDGWRGSFGSPHGRLATGSGPTKSWAVADALVRVLCP